MNRQPYQTPPRWWSPRLSPSWVRFWRPWRKRRGFQEFALCDVEVRGLQHVRQAISSDNGVLITPNHPSHVDPFVLLEAADQLKTPMFFMAAWQVFADTHRIGRRVLRQHGVFSVNREGHDVRAVRQAIRVLQDNQAPLVIFPEGEVFHLNDQVTPFRKGAVHSSVLAAERSGRPVSILPCAIKFQFLDDPTDALQQKLTSLEARIGCVSRPGMSMPDRIVGLGEVLLANRERMLLGRVGSGSLQSRIERLIETILAELEHTFGLAPLDRAAPERVKRLRQRVIRQLESPEQFSAPVRSSSALRRDLRRLFLAMQLFSYPVDYLEGDPPVERIAETLEKLEEDVLGVRRATPPARRRAIVAFDQPLIITPETARSRSVELWTQDLQRRVQNLIDGLGDVSPIAITADTDEATPALAA